MGMKARPKWKDRILADAAADFLISNTEGKDSSAARARGMERAIDLAGESGAQNLWDLACCNFIRECRGGPPVDVPFRTFK